MIQLGRKPVLCLGVHLRSKMSAPVAWGCLPQPSARLQDSGARNPSSRDQRGGLRGKIGSGPHCVTSGCSSSLRIFTQSSLCGCLCPGPPASHLSALNPGLAVLGKLSTVGLHPALPSVWGLDGTHPKGLTLQEEFL